MKFSTTVSAAAAAALVTAEEARLNKRVYTGYTFYSMDAKSRGTSFGLDPDVYPGSTFGLNLGPKTGLPGINDGNTLTATGAIPTGSGAVTGGSGAITGTGAIPTGSGAVTGTGAIPTGSGAITGTGAIPTGSGAITGTGAVPTGSDAVPTGSGAATGTGSGDATATGTGSGDATATGTGSGDATATGSGSVLPTDATNTGDASGDASATATDAPATSGTEGNGNGNGNGSEVLVTQTVYNPHTSMKTVTNCHPSSCTAAATGGNGTVAPVNSALPTQDQVNGAPGIMVAGSGLLAGLAAVVLL